MTLVFLRRTSRCPWVLHNLTRQSYAPVRWHPPVARRFFEIIPGFLPPWFHSDMKGLSKRTWILNRSLLFLFCFCCINIKKMRFRTVFGTRRQWLAFGDQSKASFKLCLVAVNHFFTSCVIHCSFLLGTMGLWDDGWMAYEGGSYSLHQTKSTVRMKALAHLAGIVAVYYSTPTGCTLRTS